MFLYFSISKREGTRNMKKGGGPKSGTVSGQNQRKAHADQLLTQDFCFKNVF